MDHQAIADQIIAAHRERRLLDPLTDEIELSLEDAYAIQGRVLARRVASGQRQVGWKLGYTSQAMRDQMGVDQPNTGPLTDAMMLEDAGTVSDLLVHPRVEPEVLVVVGREVAPGMSDDELAASLPEVRCALEVVDSVWRDYRFRIEDNTADGSSAAHFVVGPVADAAGLDRLEVAIAVDGAVQHHGTTDAVMGHPFSAVRWLAETLAGRGLALRRGDRVMTGGITPAVSLEPGATVSAAFGDVGSVSVRRAAERRSGPDGHGRIGAN